MYVCGLGNVTTFLSSIGTNLGKFILRMDSEGHKLYVWQTINAHLHNAFMLIKIDLLLAGVRHSVNSSRGS